MPPRPIDFRSEARDEFINAAAYYRDRSPVAADRFEESVRLVLSRIARHPEQFAILERPMRLAIVPGFPYYLPFRQVGERVEVLGVCHASRRPEYWRERDQGSDVGDESPS